MNDISSDDEEVSGDSFDGDGVNEDEDKDVVLEVQVDKQHEQEGVVACSENKTLPSSQQHSISSDLQQSAAGSTYPQPGTSSSPSQQADLSRDAQPPAGVDLPSASSTLQQPATGSLQAPTQITQQADVNQLSRPSAAVQEATAPGVDVPSYPALSRLNEQDLYKQELSLARATKVICSLDLLLEVFKKCQKPTCKNDSQVKYHLVGPTVVINWTCPAGHKGKFCSSRDANDMKANNLQAAAAIILSGNNFAKIEKMAKFLGLSFISETTFYRLQRLYFVPAVNEWWSWQREQIVEQFLDKEVVVCGDGQCDSPGHTAKNLCYFLMELVSGYIVEVEIRDKRHVGLVSTNMEREALQNALQRLRTTLNVVEVVTDASPSIKKMICKFSACLIIMIQ